MLKYNVDKLNLD